MSETGRRSVRLQQHLYQLGLQQPAHPPQPLPHNVSTSYNTPSVAAMIKTPQTRRSSSRQKTVAQLEASGISLAELTQTSEPKSSVSEPLEEWDETFSCSTREICDNLMANEQRLFGEKDISRFTSIQRDVTPHMRAILVDWLVEVAEEYKLQQKTLMLTVNYVDRCLSKQQVSKYTLQLLGVACMLIAAKFEEIYAPAVDDFVYISDNTYQRGEILRTEQDVLNCLEFSVCATTHSDFIGKFLSVAGCPDSDSSVRFLCDFLAELSLLELQFWKCTPSLICAAVVRLAMHTLLRPLSNTFEFEMFTRYSKAQLIEPMQHLLVLFQRAKTSSFRGVFNKYADKRYMKVSTLTPPATIPA